MNDDSEANEPIDDDKARKKADKARKQRVEFIGAVVIAIAAVLTAWVTFDAGAADGTVEQRNTDGIALTLDSNDLFNQYDAERAAERDWVFSWISARANGEPAADILEAAMPQDVADLVNEWAAANEENLANLDELFLDDPFDPNYVAYDGLLSQDYLRTGNALHNAAQCAFFEARVAEVRGDGLGLATVFLAIALVVGGIAALLNGKAAQTIVVIVSILSLLAGAGEALLANDPEDINAKAAAVFFASEEAPIPVDDSGLPRDVPAALSIVSKNCPDLDVTTAG